MRLILLGPPGAGKGTQAQLLAQEFNIPHISTGEMLRDQMHENSDLGNKVETYVKGGELVPDDIVIEVVINRLSKADAQAGFILDGFPRTINQANKLNTALKRQGAGIDLIIYFATAPAVSIKRLSGRRVCKNCGANFHITNMPPKKEGICDYCSGKLYLRADDEPETAKKRLEVYRKETASLIAYYKKSGKLRTVSGDLEAPEVNNKLLELFTEEHLAGSSK